MKKIDDSKVPILKTEIAKLDTNKVDLETIKKNLEHIKPVDRWKDLR